MWVISKFGGVKVRQRRHARVAVFSARHRDAGAFRSGGGRPSRLLLLLLLLPADGGSDSGLANESPSAAITQPRVASASLDVPRANSPARPLTWPSRRGKFVALGLAAHGDAEFSS